MLSFDNEHDSNYAVHLLSKIDIGESNTLREKAHGMKEIRKYIDAQNAVYTVSPKSDVNDPWSVDWQTHKKSSI